MELCQKTKAEKTKEEKTKAEKTKVTETKVEETKVPIDIHVQVLQKESAEATSEHTPPAHARGTQDRHPEGR